MPKLESCGHPYKTDEATVSNPAQTIPNDHDDDAVDTIRSGVPAFDEPPPTQRSTRSTDDEPPEAPVSIEVIERSGIRAAVGRGEIMPPAPPESWLDADWLEDDDRDTEPPPPTQRSTRAG
jgi:hypothetical protein